MKIKLRLKKKTIFDADIAIKLKLLRGEKNGRAYGEALETEASKLAIIQS